MTAANSGSSVWLRRGRLRKTENIKAREMPFGIDKIYPGPAWKIAAVAIYHIGDLLLSDAPDAR